MQSIPLHPDAMCLPFRYDLLLVTEAENGTATVLAASVSPYSWGGTVLKVFASTVIVYLRMDFCDNIYC